MTAERIIVWRHGRTASNAEGRFQGQLDIPLDDVGRAQATAAAAVLAEQLAGRSMLLVSSDLSRARVTAEALAVRLGVDVICDAGLREISAGAWEGLLAGEIEEAYPQEYAAWRSGADVAVGGGERRSDAGLRAARTLTAYAEKMESGVLVAASHGAALRGAILLLVGLPDEGRSALAGLRNAHWACLERRGDSWLLASYNVGLSGVDDDALG